MTIALASALATAACLFLLAILRALRPRRQEQERGARFRRADVGYYGAADRRSRTR